MSGDCRPLALTKKTAQNCPKVALGSLKAPLSNVFESCDLQHKGLLLLAAQAVVVSKSLVHFLAQLHTLALCHFMAHYHFSSTGAQEVLLSMRSIHATFLLRTSEHFTAVLSHNLVNVMNSFFFHQIINYHYYNYQFCLLVFI